jgi:hypothetical protein
MKYKLAAITLVLATNMCFAEIAETTPLQEESMVYGFYSHKQDCLSGASIYMDENGDEFRVTEVSTSATPMSNADDVVLLTTHGRLTIVRHDGKLVGSSAEDIALCILGRRIH